ncbi:MAG: twin-arginine translocase TatA/TatE family subunit [Candidatus Caenarcaniphilales bacterium]|nr:twin-arginine translocase TatA/TatE family subunit [Candidatus Caenarcaniphilales bacterium]
MFQNLGFPEIVVLCGVGLLIFGPKKLPELGKSIGEALVNFKKSFSKAVDDKPDESLGEPPDKNNSSS